MAAISARVITLVAIFGVLLICAFWFTVDKDTRDETMTRSSLKKQLRRAQKTSEAIRERLLESANETKSMEYQQHQELRTAGCEKTDAESPCIKASPERPRHQHRTSANAPPQMEASFQNLDRREEMVDKNDEIADIVKDDESCSLRSSHAVNEMLTRQIKLLLREHEERIQQSIRQSILNMQRSSSDQQSNDVTSKKDDLRELAWMSSLGFYIGGALLAYFLTPTGQTQRAWKWIGPLLFVSAFIDWNIWNHCNNQVHQEEDSTHDRSRVTMTGYIVYRIWITRTVFCATGFITIVFLPKELRDKVSLIMLYVMLYMYARVTGTMDRMEQNLSFLRNYILGRTNDLQNTEIAQPTAIAGTGEDLEREGGGNAVTNSSQSPSTERTNAAVSTTTVSTSTQTPVSSTTSRQIPYVVSLHGSITIGRYNLRQRIAGNGQSPLGETVEQFIAFMLVTIPRRSAIRRESHRRYLANMRRYLPRDR